MALLSFLFDSKPKTASAAKELLPANAAVVLATIFYLHYKPN